MGWRRWVGRGGLKGGEQMDAWVNRWMHVDCIDTNAKSPTMRGSMGWKKNWTVVVVEMK